MKFSETWLRKFIDPPLTTSELADLLTFGGIEIEAIEPAAPPFERVVVGEVLSVEKHPGADRLSVCRVNIGVAPLTIVCGAPNVAAGMRAPVALVGAKLPGIEINAAKVRGVESQGMLCSAKELGLSADAEGLLALATDALIGANVRDVLALDDQLLTSKPTPNRGDCLSIKGMAREAAALSGHAAKVIDTLVVAATIPDKPVITLDAPQACPRYCGRIVRGVDVKALTPQWMVQRLARSGIRSISAVVDITNYVMLELGQPLHAFDAAKISGGIHVRFAKVGEKLTLLNGEAREFTPDFLLIADEVKALALAGIMGGAESAVGDETRDIMLESAFFTPDVIAGKSRVLGFGSDSAFRFERGVDFAATQEAIERATRLVLDVCGGAAGPVAEAHAELPRRDAIRLRMSRAKRLLGIEISRDEARAIFRRLGFSYAESGDEFSVTPPAYRFDISIEEDLIEELARVHGFHKIPASYPVAPARPLPADERSRSASSIRRALAARDYQEVVTYSFVEAQWERDFCANSNPIKLANPIASQMAVMRSSLIGSLVNAIAYNAHHKLSRVRVFELGRCFLPDATEYLQPWRVGGAAFGEAVDEQWASRPARQIDFFDVKADVEALFQPRNVQFIATSHAAFHPGKSARILFGGKEAGWMGELHPRWQQKYDLPAPVVLFELDFEMLAARPLPVGGEISRFPPVWRDMAAVFDENTTYQAILEAVEREKPAIVNRFVVFDLYRGGGIEKGKKSLAFRMLLQDTHKTLTDAEVDSAVSEVRKIIEKRFNAKLR
jgi:phenylalanyl-tRNA synthetase beta chain